MDNNSTKKRKYKLPRLRTTQEIEKGLRLIGLPTGPVRKINRELWIGDQPHDIWRIKAKMFLKAEGYKIYLYDLDSFAWAAWYISGKVA